MIARLALRLWPLTLVAIGVSWLAATIEEHFGVGQAIAAIAVITAGLVGVYGTTRAHDWAVLQLPPVFAAAGAVHTLHLLDSADNRFEVAARITKLVGLVIWSVVLAVITVREHGPG